MVSVCEIDVEKATPDWLDGIGWKIYLDDQTASGTENDLHTKYNEVVPKGRLVSALLRINPDLPKDAIKDDERKLIHLLGATLKAETVHFTA